ncbi:hypothetical protein [Companilactobacillus furfuricola]|uniref:hypothetical protein n=1 Tax=Companilactobacillus furfuricola TaxID=1462575 RepID=UPI000F78C837|nr:hypothetical protein [Companilactobacillus furfuricola]
MNKQQLKALLSVNLRLLNPQVTNKYRSKGQTGRGLTQRIIFNLMVTTFAFVIVYGFVMIPIVVNKSAALFTYFAGIYLIFGISQSLTGISNVFFAQKDLQDYLPLPISPREVFASKIIVVTMNILPFTITLLLLFLMTSWSFGIFLPTAIVMSLILFIIITVIIELICALIIFLLSKTRFFQANQSLIMNALLMITIVIAVVGILFINNQMDGQDPGQLNGYTIGILLPLFNLFKQPLAVGSLIHWAILIALAAGLILLLKKIVISQLTAQLINISSAPHNQRRKPALKSKKTIGRSLFSYNLKLLKEPNLLVQVFSSSLLLPVIFIFSLSFTTINSGLGIKWIGVFFVGGLLLSGVTMNQTSLISNLISLDRSNFDFVASLPLSLKDYLKNKFHFGLLAQIIINSILIVLMGFMYKFGILMTFSSLLGSVVGTYLIGQFYFSRDYRLRTTNWTNITELFNRGGGNLAMILTMVIVILVGLIIIVAYSMIISYSSDPWVINGIVGLILVLAWGVVMHHFNRGFWDTLN